MKRNAQFLAAAAVLPLLLWAVTIACGLLPYLNR